MARCIPDPAQQCHRHFFIRSFVEIVAFSSNVVFSPKATKWIVSRKDQNYS